MAHIRLIGESEGELALEYGAALERAGKVFNIVKAMSLSPRILQRSMDLYREIMFGPSGLSRIERELLAVAAIHDAIQVIAYFNYINRVADAVGIEAEPEWDE